MSEKVFTSTNSEKASQTLHIDGAPDALQLDALDNVQYRADKARNDALLEGANDFDEINKACVEAALAEAGLTPEDPSYEIAKNAYEVAANASNVEWLINYRDEKGEKKPQLRHQMYEMVKRHYVDSHGNNARRNTSGHDSTSKATFDSVDATIVDPDDPDLIDDPSSSGDIDIDGQIIEYENTELVEQFTSIRTHYAELLAERSKRSFERHARTDTLDEAREEVADMIGAVATDIMDELSEVSVGERVEQDIAELIDQFIAEQMEQLANEMEAIRASEFEDARPATKKFLQRWASWGGGESWKARFKGTAKKAAILAIPTAALAIPMGLAAGAIGGVGVGALGAVLVGRGIRSIGRRLVGAKIDSVADAATIAHAQREDINHRLGLETSGVHTDLLTIFDERSEAYRKRNRNRLLGGMGIALTAGILSGTVTAAIAETGFAGHIGNLFHKDHTPNYVAGSTQPVVNPSVRPDSVMPPYAPGQEPHLPGYFESHGGNTGDTTVDGPKGGTSEKDIQFGKGELHITRGEGWYHEFNELGVKPSDQQKLLELTGKHLVKEGIAYRDPSIGGYGINMTENGKMPDAALDYITQTAHEHGIHTDYDSHFDTTSPVETNHTSATTHSQTTDTAGSGHDVDTTHSVDTTSSSLNVDINSGSTSANTFTKSDVSNFNSWANGMVVQKGDSISKYTQNYLESHGYSNPGKSQIDQVRDRILADWRSRGIVSRNGQLLKGDIIKTK